MDYTFEQFKAEIATEADNIRLYATKEERSKLNFLELNPANTERCIYGQMTGHCDSERAVELIQKCTVRYMRSGISKIHYLGFEVIQQHLNGTYVENLLEHRPTKGESAHYSMIEAYICLSDAKSENLIAYIKGETEILNL